MVIILKKLTASQSYLNILLDNHERSVVSLLYVCVRVCVHAHVTRLQVFPCTIYYGGEN